LPHDSHQGFEIMLGRFNVSVRNGMPRDRIAKQIPISLLAIARDFLLEFLIHGFCYQ